MPRPQKVNGSISREQLIQSLKEGMGIVQDARNQGSYHPSAKIELLQRGVYQLREALFYAQGIRPPLPRSLTGAAQDVVDNNIPYLANLAKNHT